MCECWREQPDSRPNFDDLRTRLYTYVDQSSEYYYQEDIQTPPANHTGTCVCCHAPNPVLSRITQHWHRSRTRVRRHPYEQGSRIRLHFANNHWPYSVSVRRAQYLSDILVHISFMQIALKTCATLNKSLRYYTRQSTVDGSCHVMKLCLCANERA
jgi:hypothetical protein